MNRKQKRKLIGTLSILLLMGGASALVLSALKQNINLFLTPTEFLHAAPQQTVRLGGYVEKGSVHYSPSGQTITFVVTDRTARVPVQFNGTVPNLFREGQTVVVTGIEQNHKFIASEVLAKHDENYMPKSLAKKLEANHAS